MSAGRSFDRVNYLLRPNKHVERKQIFDALLRLNRQVDLSKHRYIGFGSMWFVDFVMAHRLLGLREMWSIEFEENAQRAEFNKPYACIQIKAGRCPDIVASLEENDWRTPCVAWLDYDGWLNVDVASVIRTMVQNAATKSIILVTVNAERSSYRKRPPEDSDAKNIQAVKTTIQAVKTVSDVVGRDCIPNRFGDERLGKSPGGVPNDVSEVDFPDFIAESLLNYMAHAAHFCARSDATFVPLFNYAHKDGAWMSTVGGFLASHPEEAGGIRNLFGLSSEPSPSQTKLDLVQLTLKEKVALDTLLPTGEGSLPEAAKNKGIMLPIEQIMKYRDCYRHFPVFAESFF